MATKRRTKRRTPARRTLNTSTPRRRTKRRNPSTVHASTHHRHHTRRHVARRRNPSTGGLISQAAGLAAGITAVGLLQGFIPPVGGVSPFATAGRQAGTGYLLGWAMRKTGFGAKYAQDVQLAGIALGVGTLINAFILPTISGFLRPAPRQQQQGSGMQGIAVVPNFPPQLNPMAAAPAGVNGIAVSSVPGAYRRQW